MFSPGPCPVQPKLDPFTGGVHLIGALDQHLPAEESRCGAAITGVNVLPDRDDADVAPGQLSLNPNALLEVTAEPV